MIWALLPRQRQSYQRNYYLEKIKVITYVGVLNEVIDGMLIKYVSTIMLTRIKHWKIVFMTQREVNRPETMEFLQQHEV